MSENLQNKSMVDVAYDVMLKEKRILRFDELFKLVCVELGFDDETSKSKVSKFYTNLSLDGRFVTLTNNTWDLRVNQTFDKVHIDMKDVYSAIEQEHSSGSEDLEDIDEDDADIDKEEELENYGDDNE